MGSQDSQEQLHSKRKKHSRRGMGGSDLVMGIATVVVVGVAGKFLSKLRKPEPPDTTAATASLDKIISGDGHSSALVKKVVSNGEDERPDAREVLENDGKLCPKEALINGERASSLHTEKSSCDDAVSISATQDSNLASTELKADDDEAAKTSGNAALRDETGGALPVSRSKHLDFTSVTALSEMVNHALLASNHDDLSETDLVMKEKAFNKGIAEVISRAFEDFGSGDLSGDEIEVTKLKLRVTEEGSLDCKGSSADSGVDSATLSEHIAAELRDSVVGGEPASSAIEDPRSNSSPTEADAQVDRVSKAPATEVELSCDSFSSPSRSPSTLSTSFATDDSFSSPSASQTTDSRSVVSESLEIAAVVSPQVKDQATYKDARESLAPSVKALCGLFGTCKVSEFEATLDADGPTAACLSDSAPADVTQEVDTFKYNGIELTIAAEGSSSEDSSGPPLDRASPDGTQEYDTFKQHGVELTIDVKVSSSEGSSACPPDRDSIEETQEGIEANLVSHCPTCGDSSPCPPESTSTKENPEESLLQESHDTVEQTPVDMNVPALQQARAENRRGEALGNDVDTEIESYKEVDLGTGSLDTVSEKVKVTSILESTDDASTEITAVDVTDIRAPIRRMLPTAERRVTSLEMKSLVYPAALSEVGNTTKVQSQAVAVSNNRKTSTVTTMEFSAPLASSRTERSEEESLRDKLPLQLVGVGVFIALIASLVWALREHMKPYIPLPL